MAKLRSRVTYMNLRPHSLVTSKFPGMLSELHHLLHLEIFSENYIMRDPRHWRVALSNLPQGIKTIDILCDDAHLVFLNYRDPWPSNVSIYTESSSTPFMSEHDTREDEVAHERGSSFFFDIASLFPNLTSFSLQWPDNTGHGGGLEVSPMLIEDCSALPSSLLYFGTSGPLEIDPSQISMLPPLLHTIDAHLSMSLYIPGSESTRQINESIASLFASHLPNLTRITRVKSKRKFETGWLPRSLVDTRLTEALVWAPATLLSDLPPNLSSLYMNGMRRPGSTFIFDEEEWPRLLPSGLKEFRLFGTWISPILQIEHLDTPPEAYQAFFNLFPAKETARVISSFPRTHIDSLIPLLPKSITSLDLFGHFIDLNVIKNGFESKQLIQSSIESMRIESSNASSHSSTALFYTPSTTIISSILNYWPPTLRHLIIIMTGWQRSDLQCLPQTVESLHLTMRPPISLFPPIDAKEFTSSLNGSLESTSSHRLMKIEGSSMPPLLTSLRIAIDFTGHVQFELPLPPGLKLLHLTRIYDGLEFAFSVISNQGASSPSDKDVSSVIDHTHSQQDDSTRDATIEDGLPSQGVASLYRPLPPSITSFECRRGNLLHLDALPCRLANLSLKKLSLKDFSALPRSLSSLSISSLPASPHTPIPDPFSLLPPGLTSLIISSAIRPTKNQWREECFSSLSPHFTTLNVAAIGRFPVAVLHHMPTQALTTLKICLDLIEEEDLPFIPPNATDLSFVDTPINAPDFARYWPYRVPFPVGTTMSKEYTDKVKQAEKDRIPLLCN